MSSDDENDYMSDAFLQSICGKEDIRPGLYKSHSQKYDHDRDKKKFKTDEINKSRNPSLKEREVASREDALGTPIDSDNVGFKMLQKLGFKPGSGLGKSGEGMLEPVPVELKTDRLGLGRKASLQEVARLRQKFRNEAREKMLNVDDYRARKAEEAAEKRAAADLSKSQRVCWELDSKECIEEPAEAWFWPEKKLPADYGEANGEEEEEEETEQETEPSSMNNEEQPEDSGDVEDDYPIEEEFSVQEKLEMLTLYLRRTYCYCIWCGHGYEDEKDLEQECPGPCGTDH